MKSLTTLGIILLLTFSAFGQILTPVKWNMDHKSVGNDEFELIFTATIDDGWKVYSQYLESQDGPIPTSFTFEEGDHFEKVGKTEESEVNRKEAFEKFFDMNVVSFTKTGTFTQKVKVKDYSKPITGYLEFMCCDATQCLPPSEEDFEFALTAATGAVEPAKERETEVVTTDTKEQQEPIQEVVKEPTKIIKETAPTIGTVVLNNKQQNTVPQKEAPKKIIEKPVKKIEQTAPKIVLNQPTTPPADEMDETSDEVYASVENEGMEDSGILDPADWTVKAEKIADQEYNLTFTATMDKGWYIYSQHTQDGGPIPTAFYYNQADHYELVGEAKEIGNLKTAPEPAFGPDVTVTKFVGGTATFVQRVKVTDANKPITGELEFMACNNETCTPPLAEPYQIIPASLTASIGGEMADLSAGGGIGDSGPSMDDGNALIQDCGSPQEEESKGLWSIFGLGFIGGLLALLTPCVFPMIPLTVSFFTKGSENRTKGLTNAFLYGLFIFLVYIILSIPFHLMDSINPDILNEISTNVWLNVFFFLIFMFFAFSFFGYYELTLPESWLAKSSSAEGAGGILGIFFMALTLALVSFSCTGPILGSLLAGALTSDGGAMQLTSGMGGFGLALALPFGLFALFPSMMKALPKSGGWLNTVKVTLGFLEVAAAFKFLSNADLVSHWNVLKVEPVLLIWIATFIGLGLYMFGKIKFPHDSPLKNLGLGRILTGLASFAFAAYMATGLLYDKDAGSLKSLTLLSGFAPPACYSFMYPCDCPQNLNCFKDYDQGITHAKKANKPILLDFTGYACVNCRKMEENVWPQDKVYDQLKEKYVLISLYVDDKKELPESEQVEVVRANGTKRKLRTYGHKWAHFQAARFQSNTQPYYVLLTPDGKQRLNNPVGYMPEVDEYSNFLECGLNAFDKYQGKREMMGLK